jgi:hypothetical protein
MMKKLFIVLAVFVFVAGFAFAQEDATERERDIEFFNMQISVGFPVHWTNGLHDDTFYPSNTATGDNMMEDRSVTANTSIGLALVFNFTKGFGFILDMDMFFGAKLSGFAAPTSDYNSLFGANVFFGPVFYLFNNNGLRIPFAVGAHMYYFADDLWVTELNSNGAWVNRSELQLGAAASLGLQFHFNRSTYMFTNTTVAINFVRMHSRKWFDSVNNVYEEMSCTDMMEINWGVKPSIGLGIKF